MKKLYAFMTYFSFLFFLNNLCKESVLVIIHGTFAQKEQWYKPNGDFFKAVENFFSNHTIASFTWSGGPSVQDRSDGAQKLLLFLLNLSDTYKNISIIAHSHGANVAIEALHKATLYNHKIFIKRFYTLAPPINQKFYNPPMHRIEQLHNLFSFGDCIQTVHNVFERTFKPHPRITNTEIKIDNFCPGHSDLHSPLIAFLLPQLETLLFKNHNCVIYLSHNTLPQVTIDNERENALLYDKQFIQTIASCFARTTINAYSKKS